jgi:hypothetical protein
MITLYILGFLAFCYLLAGPAGFAAFWYFVRWPIVIILALATLLNFPIYGFNPLLLLIVMTILACIDIEKLPDWFWDLMNLLVYVCLLVAVGWFLVQIGVLK